MLPYENVSLFLSPDSLYRHSSAFFPCSAFSLSTCKHLTRQTPSYHPQDET